MSDLVGNPEDLFSRVAAHVMVQFYAPHNEQIYYLCTKSTLLKDKVLNLGFQRNKD